MHSEITVRHDMREIEISSQVKFRKTMSQCQKFPLTEK